MICMRDDDGCGRSSLTGVRRSGFQFLSCFKVVTDWHSRTSAGNELKMDGANARM